MTAPDLDEDDNDEKWSAFTAHKSGLIRKWSGSALTMGRDTTEEPEPTSLFKSGKGQSVHQWHWPCHENGPIETTPMIPHNLCVSFSKDSFITQDKNEHFEGG